MREKNEIDSDNIAVPIKNLISILIEFFIFCPEILVQEKFASVENQIQ